ncbi:unnamed protein product [Linum tenue]|uniref:Fe2OG dioxygenase domain-containing protein n=1 Tax=Linum tenue TaxID=586396 RepID=A0AAV0MLQ4_9ROSI|nr:unnamed protein product [Linum tenue]
MGSETAAAAAPLKIPLIDFSETAPLKQDSLEWDSLRSQVREAVEEYGCFEASFDGIPADSLSAVFKSVKELFDLPLETKLKNTSKIPLHGYVGQWPSLPLYESMGIEDADVLQKVEGSTKALWSNGNPAFRLSVLDQMVRRMIVESFGLEKYVDEHLNSTTYLLRVMEYKAARSCDEVRRIHPHTDKDMITILYQNGVDGLEVKNKADGQWIKCQFSRTTSFIVLVGDSLYAWLNGRVHSPVHRVTMSRSETRYSLGLFVVPKAGYVVKAPDEMVDEQHPLLFKPYDFVEFFMFYGTEAGLKSANALREYCGV